MFDGVLVCKWSWLWCVVGREIVARDCVWSAFVFGEFFFFKGGDCDSFICIVFGSCKSIYRLLRTVYKSFTSMLFFDQIIIQNYAVSSMVITLLCNYNHPNHNHYHHQQEQQPLYNSTAEQRSFTTLCASIILLDVNMLISAPVNVHVSSLLNSLSPCSPLHSLGCSFCNNCTFCHHVYALRDILQ